MPSAAQELLRRRQARTAIEHFTTYTFPDYEVNWHHRLLCSYLDRFALGLIPRLMVFMPPRHGKSQLVSRHLPAYILGRNPDASIIACSYGADLSSRMNRDVQRIIDTEAYARLFPASRLYGKNVRAVAQGSYLRNSEIFEIVGRRGVYRSAGIGGGITGMGMQFGIIDDPIKSASEAESITYRDGLWDWYTSTFYTRLEKHGAILITLTRWHEDDLAGRLLALAASTPDADQWTVLSLPAVCEDAQRMPGDIRADGAPLWENRFNLAALAKIRLAIGSYHWSALYQQQPSSRDGGMFGPSVPIVGAVPTHAKRIRYWDKAGAAPGKGDYTVGVLLAYQGGVTYVEDVVRGQWQAAERNAKIRETAELDRQLYGAVAQWIEQPPGLAKEATDAVIALLQGFAVYADPVKGDKVERAEPFASQWQAGNVKLVRGDWNRAYLEELRAFPTGKHDDQVDASSGAYNKLHQPSRMSSSPARVTTAADLFGA